MTFLFNSFLVVYLEVHAAEVVVVQCGNVFFAWATFRGTKRDIRSLRLS